MASYLLLQDGGKLLLQDGGGILLGVAPAPTTTETQQVGGANREMDRQLRDLLVREDDEILLLI